MSIEESIDDAIFDAKLEILKLKKKIRKMKEVKRMQRILENMRVKKPLRFRYGNFMHR
jgi:hypothetical protein